MKSFNDITRRDFLKSVGLAAAAATFGCATTEIPKQDIAASSASIISEQVVYPKLPGNKIQAPDNGCMVGLRKVYGRLGSAGEADMMREYSEAAQKATGLDELNQLNKPLNDKYSPILLENLEKIITYYQARLAANPRILVMYETPRIFIDFKSDEAGIIASRGMVPYINAGVYARAKNLSLTPKEIMNGKHDKHIVEHAKGARQFGEKHGGFFMTTMEEANGNWPYWGQDSKFVPAWRHIWHIFEDQGANQCATWVWEFSCKESPSGGAFARIDPESMYPGDKYVDWIGMSAFSRDINESRGLTLGALITQNYDRMRKNHSDKPIMQAEFGKSNRYDQPRWLIDAYKNIKTLPGIKAAIFWDNVSIGDDHTLSEKSLQAMKEIFQDPYWIMAK